MDVVSVNVREIRSVTFPDVPLAKGSFQNFHGCVHRGRSQSEDANILKDMYIMRFNGFSKDDDTHDQMDTSPRGPMPPLITSLQPWHPNNIRDQKEKEKRGVG
jgi:hypothetical protein